MAEDYRFAAYKIKGRIIALRERLSYSPDDLSRHLAQYWNVAPLGAACWIRKLESEMLLEDMGDVRKRASWRENFQSHQRRIFDYLAALGIADEHSCRTILDGIKQIGYNMQYQRSEVKPLSPLEKSVQGS